MRKLFAAFFKGRRFLSVLSFLIVVCCVLILYCSFAYQGALKTVLTGRMAADGGASDVVVKADELSNENFVNPHYFQEDEQVSWSVGVFYTQGYLSSAQKLVSVYGMAFSGIEQLYPTYSLESPIDFFDKLEQNEVIVTKALAKELGLSVGSDLPLQIAGQKRICRVCGILTGPDGAPDDDMRVFVDLACFGIPNRLYNRVYVKLVPGADIGTYIDTVSTLPDFQGRSVGLGFDVDAVSERTTELGSLFLICAVLMITTALILLSQLTQMRMRERRKHIAVLLSAGMSVGQFRVLMIADAMLSAVPGCILGGGVASLVFRILCEKTILPGYRYFSLGALLGAMGVALVLVLSTQTVIAVRYFRVTLCENRQEATMPLTHPHPRLLLVLTALLIPSFCLSLRTGRWYGILSLLTLVLCICVEIVAVPVFLSFLCAGLRRMGVFLREAYTLARDSRFASCATVAAVILSVMLVMNHGVQMMNTCDAAIAQWTDSRVIAFAGCRITEEDIAYLRSLDSVTEVIPYQNYAATLCRQGRTYPLELTGSDAAGAEKSIYRPQLSTQARDALESDTDSIVLSRYYQEICGFRIGDSVTLVIHGQTREVRVAAFAQLINTSAKVGFCSASYLSGAFPSVTENTVAVQTSQDPHALCEELFTAFEGREFVFAPAHAIYTDGHDLSLRAKGFLTRCTYLFDICLVTILICRLFLVKKRRADLYIRLYLLGDSRKSLILHLLTEALCGAVVICTVACLAAPFLTDAAIGAVRIVRDYRDASHVPPSVPWFAIGALALYVASPPLLALIPHRRKEKSTVSR